MWIITRNEYQALTNDGTWTYRYNTDDLKVFDERELAKEWIEDEAIPDEFVLVESLGSLLGEKSRRNDKERKRERSCLFR